VQRKAWCCDSAVGYELSFDCRWIKTFRTTIYRGICMGERKQISNSELKLFYRVENTRIVFCHPFEEMKTIIYLSDLW